MTAFSAFAVKRAMFYTEFKLIAVLIFALLWLLLYLFVLHLMMQKVGITKVDAVVMRVGSEQTLAKLSEGLIVLDNENSELLYSNKAAIIDKYSNSNSSQSQPVSEQSRDMTKDINDKKVAIHNLNKNILIPVDPAVKDYKKLTCEEYVKQLT